MLARHKTSLRARFLLTTFGLVSCSIAAAPAIDKDKAIFFGGTVSGDYQRAGGTRFPAGKERLQLANYGLRVAGRIDLSNDAAFEFDAGHQGRLMIPYAAITSIVYGPGFLPSITPRPRSKYRWSNYSHRATPYLRIVFRDHTGKEEDALFELGSNLVRPTLGALETKAKQPVDFQTVTGCVQYKAEAECGYGRPTDLKGLKKVFVDTTGTIANTREDIRAEIMKANIGLEVVPTLQDAEILLHLNGHDGSIWSPKIEKPEARAEVYAVRPEGLVIVLLFEKTATVWNRNLAASFAKDFLKAYTTAQASSGLTIGGIRLLSFWHELSDSPFFYRRLTG